jgi:hypothetical protein
LLAIVAMKSLSFVLAAVGCFASPRFALAQEGDPGWESAPAEEAEAAPTEPAPVEPAPAASTQPAKMNVETPEPEAPVQRSYHVHDGFYLRANIGLGAYGVRYDDDVNAGGASLAFDLMIGGSPSPGFVIGGALLGDFNRNLSVRQGDRDIGEASVGTGLIGPFVDGFPNSKGGWHLGGMIGLATVRTEDLPGSDEVRTDQGVGGAVFGGYDAWVADEFAIGGLMRFSAAVARSEDSETGRKLDSTSTALTLMFTALYH